MDNKLSELSKPVMYVVRTLDGSVASVKSHSYTAPKGFTSEPLYSQEYVSALLARIAELEAGHQEAAKQIASWRRIAKQNIEEREKDLAALDAERQKITGLEAKMATPVRLPDTRQSVSGERYQWSDGVFNYKQDAIAMLRAAGFKVEGDE